MNRRVSRAAPAVLGIALLIVSASIACVSNPVLQHVTAPAPCEAPADAHVEWMRATAPDERRVSAAWCAGVGGPLVRAAAVPAAADAPLAVVSWNVHVGGGDIERLMADLTAGRLTAVAPRSTVLLLQEVERQGPPVPATPPPRSRFASSQTPAPPDGSRRLDIATVADALDLSLFYAPSMRNGRIREDRGSAILASTRLDRLQALELPFEHQRRVAVFATIRLRGRDATPIDVRLACTHFTNMVPHHLWALSEPARVRQARALARLLHDGRPTILGGDFNSWFGSFDAAYRELARIFPPQGPTDGRPTFGPMRLDHLLSSLPPGWRMEVRRADDRYGSDHYPLIALVRPR